MTPLPFHLNPEPNEALMIIATEFWLSPPLQGLCGTDSPDQRSAVSSQ